MVNAVCADILRLLQNGVDADIKNFSVINNDSNKKGEGYLGQMCYVSLKSKSNGQVFHFVIKQAFTDDDTRSVYAIRGYFLNEIYFYDEVWPSFQRFQERLQLEARFDKIAKCFATCSDDNNEKLVFENLKFQNFQVADKRRSFDKEHFEFIFKQYGRFHAISFAYKMLNPKEYSELTKGLENRFCKLANQDYYRELLKLLAELCLNSLHPVKDAEVIGKFEKYLENSAEILINSSIYKGEYSVILHGDCWSNNMLFKYDEQGNLTDMRLIDFQFCYEGTPVSDLSYCLYSGGSKEIFDDLDHYLKVYHDSLSQTLVEFGCYSDNVYPFEELRKDWKHHCQLGVLLSFNLWRAKVTYENSAIDLTDTDVEKNFAKVFMATQYDDEAFRNISRDIILHLYENDFL